MEFTRKLNKEGVSFDYVILTVGSWPDRETPKTVDGLDRVVALDLFARFLIIREVLPLMKDNARVMSVLASTQRMPFPAADAVKALISGQSESYWVPQMLFSVGLAHDALLLEAASRYPYLKFIGTHPGLVPTDLLVTSRTFPSWLSSMGKAVLTALAATPLPFFLTEEACAVLHLQILSSPIVERLPSSFFNYYLEGRKVNELSYDVHFREWLWTFLESTSNKLYMPWLSS